MLQCGSDSSPAALPQGVADAYLQLPAVSPRVRGLAGRLTADKQTGEELHNQIARVLTERLEASRPPTPVQNDALASLEAQVRSLRMELAHQREASVPPATS